MNSEEKKPTMFRELAPSILKLGVHLTIGVVFHMYHSSLSFIEALYFCVVTTTTVGYGDIVPEKDVSALLFQTCYVLASVIIIGSCVADIVGRVFKYQTDKLIRVASKRGLRNYASETSAHNWRRFQINLSIMATVFALEIGMVMIWEELSPIEAFYFAVVSMTTVGYGDYAPKTPIGRATMTVWLAITTIGLLEVIGSYANAKLFDEQNMSLANVVSSMRSMTNILDMDTDNSGDISKPEFIIGILLKTEAIDKAIINQYSAKFDELDCDGSGTITPQDFAQVSASLSTKKL